jgi:hypothetical protein
VVPTALSTNCSGIFTYVIHVSRLGYCEESLAIGEKVQGNLTRRLAVPCPDVGKGLPLTTALPGKPAAPERRVTDHGDIPLLTVRHQAELYAARLEVVADLVAYNLSALESIFGALHLADLEVAYADKPYLPRLDKFLHLTIGKSVSSFTAP